jgi:hypothetical protein
LFDSGHRASKAASQFNRLALIHFNDKTKAPVSDLLYYVKTHKTKSEGRQHNGRVNYLTTRDEGFVFTPAAMVNFSRD